ncbi:4019_t:CDS:2 [Funneliformis caledonium]|uniref:4019_t:CDS:1 n=1 Tax=Funneliformis caledonium TaxID=1117310 RepID=A0A9N8ZA43_9GLOM|nr:4019_t:CDS:2 [Funneliformis caledonium]
MRELLRINSATDQRSYLPIYGESQPTKVYFSGGDVDDLKAAIREKFKPSLDDVATADIILRLHDEEVALEPDRVVERSFGQTARKPLKVIVSRGKGVGRQSAGGWEVRGSLVTTL